MIYLIIIIIGCVVYNGIVNILEILESIYTFLNILFITFIEEYN